MPADLGLVADATERHANELATRGARDRLADRRLARARRADEREDRARAPVDLDPALLAQLRHRDVLDDSLLDVVEAGVVRVQHLARELRIEALFGALVPRHRQQPVEVVPDHGGLGRLVAHALEPRQLALRLLEHVLRHLGIRDLRPVLLDDGALVLARAPCGSSRAAGAGCTRAAACRLPTRRPPGSASESASARGARAGARGRARAARARRRSREAAPSARS